MSRARPEVNDPLVADFWFLGDPGDVFGEIAIPLRQPASAFNINIRNIKNTLLLPIRTVGEMVRRNQRTQMKVHATLARGTDYDDPNIASEIEAVMQTPLFMEKLADSARDNTNGMLAIGAFRDGLQSNLKSATSSAWTAIECLAGDAWEAVVNEYPAAIPEGALKRQKVDEPSAPASDGISDKGIAFWQLRQAQFDLRKCMGTLLRGKFDFTSVEGIERAYVPILGDEVKTLVDVQPLLVLEAARHVLVHRGGVVDADYVRRWKRIFKAEPLGFGAGSPIPLDSGIVAFFVNTAASIGIQLVLAVDRWVKSSMVR